MPKEPSKTLKQIEDELDNKPVDKRKEEKKLVVRRGGDGLYVVEFNAGGEVPDVLKGRWTNLQRANAAVAEFELMKAQVG